MRDPAVEFYADTLKHVWQQTSVPTPQQLADWIASRPWRVDPEWLAKILTRLRAWPEGRNFPLIPDDDALWEMQRYPSVVSLWWQAGARRGDLTRSFTPQP